MQQAAAYDSGWASDSTTAGAIREETVADRFNQEFSFADRKQHFDATRAYSQDSTHADNDSVALMLGGLDIIDDTAADRSQRTKTSAEYERAYYGTGAFTTDSGDRSSMDSLLRSGSFARASDRTPPADPLAAGIETQEKGAARPARAGDRSQAAAEDTGIPHLSDNSARDTIQWASFDQQQKAKALKADILAGKDVSEAINKLGRDEKTAVMTILKNELANTPGTRVIVTTGDDRSRHLLFMTKGGAKVQIAEDSYGQPQDIQVNGIGLRTIAGAKDVYDRQGENKTTASGGGGFNPIDYLRKTTQGGEGNGPLAKYVREEPLTAEEWQQLKEMSRKSGGKVFFYEMPTGGKRD